MGKRLGAAAVELVVQDTAECEILIDVLSEVAEQNILAFGRRGSPAPPPRGAVKNAKRQGRIGPRGQHKRRGLKAAGASGRAGDLSPTRANAKVVSSFSAAYMEARLAAGSLSTAPCPRSSTY